MFSSSPESVADKVSLDNLEQHVHFLSSLSPRRSFENVESLNSAADYITKTLTSYGYEPHYQKYKVDGREYKNIIVSLNPSDQPKLIMGAHYDSHENTPGADDNASGVSGLLELARISKQQESQIPRPVDFVFYTLEEPPAFRTQNMGSYVHAQSLKDKNEKIDLMVSIEMIGYFNNAKGSQHYPLPQLAWWFPNQANFIALIGKLDQWMMMRNIKTAFANHTTLSVESLNAPRKIKGIDFSDHLNYWNNHQPAIMVSDTSFFRNSHYHEPTDTPETLNYKKMAEVVSGLYGLVKEPRQFSNNESFSTKRSTSEQSLK
ncbi:MAG: M28 family peptidase [Bdellovibrionales bacterium]|nr:M28 family peptidase [Bdellovibrionales bacterium]